MVEAFWSAYWRLEGNFCDKNGLENSWNKKIVHIFGIPKRMNDHREIEIDSSQFHRILHERSILIIRGYMSTWFSCKHYMSPFHHNKLLYNSNSDRYKVFWLVRHLSLSISEWYLFRNYTLLAYIFIDSKRIFDHQKSRIQRCQCINKNNSLSISFSNDWT